MNVHEDTLKAPACIAFACGAVALLSANESGAAQWLLKPAVRVASEYSDNPRLLFEGAQSRAGASGDVYLNVERLTEQTRFALRPRLTSSRYSTDEALESDNRYVTATFDHQLERMVWSTTADFTRDTTLTSELESTGLTERNRPHEAIYVSLSPTLTLNERTSAGLQASWTDHHYINAKLTGLQDYEYRSLTAFSSYALSERSKWSLTARGGQLRVTDQPASNKQDAALMLGWKYVPLPLWTVDLSAGPSYARTDFANEDGFVFRAEAKRQEERWSLTASAGRDLSPNGRGALTRRDQVSIGTSRWLTGYLSASLTLRGVRTRDVLIQAPRARELEYGRVEVQLNWNLSERWSLAAGLGAATQRLDSRTHNADNHGASLSIIWNGQTQSL